MVQPTTYQPTAISPIRGQNSNVDKYVWDLRGAWGGLRIWDNDFALSRDPWIYEKMERDPLIRQCLWDRVSTVGGREWSIVPPDSATEEEVKLAQVIQQAIGELKYARFDSARINLARFFWYGATFAAVYGTRKLRKFGIEPEAEEKAEELADEQEAAEPQEDAAGSIGQFAFGEAPEDGGQDDFAEEKAAIEAIETVAREWWVPTKIRDISKRRIRVWREGGEVKRTIERILDANGEVSYEKDDFPSDRIIAAIYDDQESQLGFGRGIADACYWPFRIRWKIREEGYDAARAWAQGILHGKTDASQLGSVDQDSESVRDDLIEALKNMQSRGVIVTGLTDEINPLDGLGSGAQLLLDWDQRLADDIRCLIAGSKLPTGGGGEVGSLAREGGEAETSEGIYQTDSRLLDEVLTDDLVRPVFERNTENIEALGLGEARMPFFRSQADRVEDVAEVRENLKTAREIGLDIKKDEAYAKLKLTAPTAKDIAEGNVIEAQDPNAVDPNDPFGGGGGDPFGGAPAGEDAPDPSDGDDWSPSRDEFKKSARYKELRAEFEASFGADWDEGKHPRKGDGEFAPKGGGEASSKADKKAASVAARKAEKVEKRKASDAIRPERTKKLLSTAAGWVRQGHPIDWSREKNTPNVNAVEFPVEDYDEAASGALEAVALVSAGGKLPSKGTRALLKKLQDWEHMPHILERIYTSIAQDAGDPSKEVVAALDSMLDRAGTEDSNPTNFLDLIGGDDGPDLKVSKAVKDATAKEITETDKRLDEVKADIAKWEAKVYKPSKVSIRVGGEMGDTFPAHILNRKRQKRTLDRLREEQLELQSTSAALKDQQSKFSRSPGGRSAAPFAFDAPDSSWGGESTHPRKGGKWAPGPHGGKWDEDSHPRGADNKWVEGSHGGEGGTAVADDEPGAGATGGDTGGAGEAPPPEAPDAAPSDKPQFSPEDIKKAQEEFEERMKAAAKNNAEIIQKERDVLAAKKKAEQDLAAKDKAAKEAAKAEADGTDGGLGAMEREYQGLRDKQKERTKLHTAVSEEFFGELKKKTEELQREKPEAPYWEASNEAQRRLDEEWRAEGKKTPNELWGEIRAESQISYELEKKIRAFKENATIQKNAKLFKGKPLKAVKNNEHAAGWAMANLGIKFQTTTKAGTKNRRALAMLQEAKDAGVELPTITFSSDVFRRHQSAVGIYSQARPGEISLNPKYFANDDQLATTATQQHANNWWSTDSPIGTVVHEIAHMLHHKENPTEFETLPRQRGMSPAAIMSGVAAEVSKEDVSTYGLTSPVEFVAETYAKYKISGEQMPANVAKWYETFKGPKI